MGQHLRKYELPRYTLWEKYGFSFAPSIIVPSDAEEFSDVSFYQDPMRWGDYPYRSAIIRIGQNVWKDTAFEYNYAECKARGIAVGGYWFFDGRVSPQAQVDVIKSAMAGKSFELELFIDFEKNYGGAYEGLANAVKLMQLVEAAGIKCKAVGMYTGYYYFGSNHTTTSFDVYLKQRPLWLAWYASASVVKIPLPWLEYTHWQWGTPTIYVGQPTAEVDANKSRYSAAEFGSRYLGGMTPPDGGTMDYVTGTTTASDSAGGLRVRSSKVTADTSNVVGYLPYGTKVEGWLDGDWINIIYNGAGAYISKAWVTNISVINPPPDPPTENKAFHMDADFNADGTITGTWNPLP